MASGELEQIQFLLGHVSIQTTDTWGASNVFDGRSTNESFIEPTLGAWSTCESRAKVTLAG